MTEAFRPYAIESPRELRNLRRKLIERRAEIVLSLGEGHARTWEDYKHRTGLAAGLAEAIAICDQEGMEE